MKKKYPFLLLTYFIIIDMTFYAQNSINSSGGDITNGNGESIAYSIGQVFYQKVESGDIFISEGVQQPYELNTASIQTIDYSIQINIHPNPTSEDIIISSNNFTMDDFQIKLYDVSGTVLIDSDIKGLKHEIDLNNYPKASYQLIILNSKKETILSSKIIKI